VLADCGNDIIIIYDVTEHLAETIWCANTSSIWIRL